MKAVKIVLECENCREQLNFEFESANMLLIVELCSACTDNKKKADLKKVINDIKSAIEEVKKNHDIL
jgi:hypothetical protein